LKPRIIIRVEVPKMLVGIYECGRVIGVVHDCEPS
jgi:hypothetical protein